LAPKSECFLSKILALLPAHSGAASPLEITAEFGAQAFKSPRTPFIIGFVLDHAALVALMHRPRIFEPRLIEFGAERTASVT